MPKHLQKEIKKLEDEVVQLAATVDENLKTAVTALETRDEALAAKALEADDAIDHMEVEIEEECLKILALHQPVAKDLRLIIAILKINNDLERIGDLAVNIAKRTTYLARLPEVEIQVDFHGMVQATKTMVHDCLHALFNNDLEMAQKVCLMDDTVDNLNREMFTAIREGIRKEPQLLDTYINLLSASRNLERIADHACNIAEDVIYMIEGEIVRHHFNEAGG